MSEVVTKMNAFLDAARIHLSGMNIPHEYGSLEKISTSSIDLNASLVAIGDLASADIEISLSGKEAPSYGWSVIFEWMEEAKLYMVLWRDVLFEYQKALILLHDGVIEEHQLQIQHGATIGRLEEATDALAEQIPSSTANLKLYETKVEEWKLLADPWATYKTQFEELSSQALSLLVDHQALDKVVTTTKSLVQLSNNESEHFKNQIATIRDFIIRTKEFMSEHTGETNKVSMFLESIEQELRTAHNLESYQSQADQLLAELSKSQRVPISVDGGPLRYQQINFARQIRQWLDTEVQPGLHDMADLVDRVSNSLRMALINIRNRAIIITKEGQSLQEDALKTELHQPLLLIEEKLDEWEADLSQLDYVIGARIEKSLNVATVYEGREEYLPVPLQTTLTQFKLDQNELYVRFSSWFRRQSESFRSIKNIVIREESLSDADKIVRYVRSRTIEDDRAQYDSLFKAQGYIGESFCVGRTHELREMEASISAWREGYRGAAVLTGRRHSGKTLFGEWVSHRYFPTETITLRANNILNVNGRRLTVKHDLAEALEFIKKHSINKRYLVWIDDIETWESTDCTASHNIRALIKYMDNLSHRLYFLVSMGPWTMHHWESIHGIKSAFQTTIDLRPLTDKEVREAILIRHGATHKRLVNEETGENLNSTKFGKMVQQVHRLSNEVIGDTLLLWANGTTIEEGDTVVFHEPASFALPDFIEPDIAILLRMILYRRSCTDYELRKFFGVAYKQRFSAILQRQIAMGIIERRVDGRLEIAEGVVNDIAHLLEEHSYITITKED